jgi:hypothetical protein
VQRERVFRLFMGVTLGTAAAAAFIGGFRETPTTGQLLCLLMATALAGIGGYLGADPLSVSDGTAASLEKKVRRRHSLLGTNEANGTHLGDVSPGCMHALVRIRTSP